MASLSGTKVVPVSGMLFGNATSAAALAVTGLLRGFAEQSRSAVGALQGFGFRGFWGFWV